MAGEIDTWTLEASIGDTIELRVGTATFTPRIELYAPGGTLAAAGSVNSTANRDAGLAHRATASGTFSVQVKSLYAGGTGSYRLHVVKAPGAITISDGDEGGALTQGARHSGTIEVGDLDAWTFSANAGDSLELRAGTTNFTPWIRLYGPDGALVDSASVNSTANRDAGLSYRTTVAGQFTAVVQSLYNNGAGPYTLHFAQLPGNPTVSSGDEGGALSNGARHPGTIDVGDLDVWTFSASVGNSVELRVGTANFTPLIRLYGPDGALVDSASVNSTANRDAGLTYRATVAGQFTAVVQSLYNNGAGPYTIHFAQLPGNPTVSSGDEGGALSNGARHPGTIDVGDLDVWTFSASVGNSLELRVGTTNFTPLIRLYGPDGALVDSASVNSTANRDAGLTYRATVAGQFTAVVQSLYNNGAGPYTLHFAQAPGDAVVSPGDEGWLLTNGAQHPGRIDVGDLDVWSFGVNAGDSIELRAGTTDFTPVFRLYGPDGTLLGTASVNSTANRDAGLTHRAAVSGIFTVVISSLYANGAGAYTLNFVVTPGASNVSANDEGGPLTNGANHRGTVAVGDLDLWHFDAAAGDTIDLRVGTTAFTPLLRLYGPDGTLLETASVNSTANRDAWLQYQTTGSGTFSLVLASLYANGSGDYQLRLFRTPADFQVTQGDEGGSLLGGQAVVGVMDLGDIDGWRFTACRGDVIDLRLVTVDFSPWMALYGADGRRIRAVSVNSTANRTLSITYQVVQGGTFTVVVTGLYANSTGTYQLMHNGLSDGLKLCRPEIAGGQAKLTGVGGVAEADGVLYTSPDATAASSGWTPVVTNRFDAVGAFEHSVPHHVTEPERYFRLVRPRP